MRRCREGYIRAEPHQTPEVEKRRHDRLISSRGGVLRWLINTCTELSSVHPAFKNLHFTPHNYRRLFATELANSGLPIHIGAALLGHLDLDSFRGYVTVTSVRQPVQLVRQGFGDGADAAV